MKEGYDIDFVIVWVDGNDPKWIKDFNKHVSTDCDVKTVDVRPERYKDYGLLKYWFRGVEKYAPWERTVHFVTNGQKPDWLNLNSPKLNFVKHSDYIPKEFLPVFSSHPIELMLHKIPDLAEHFVYFNDDFYLVSPVSKKYYFKKGLPCDFGSLSVIGLGKNPCRIPHVLLNDMIEINKNFEKEKVLRSNFFKWFSFKSWKNILKNFFMLPWSTIPCISARHHAQPYLKSTFEEVWKNCPEVLTLTMSHRFRNKYQDVNQWLFRFWQLCSGMFYSENFDNSEKMVSLSKWNEEIKRKIQTHSYKEICIDDDTDEVLIDDFENKMMSVIDMFEHILPEKSSFEF